MHHVYSWCPQKPERASDVLELELQGSCEQSSDQAMSPACGCDSVGEHLTRLREALESILSFLVYVGQGLYHRVLNSHLISFGLTAISQQAQ